MGNALMPHAPIMGLTLFLVNRFRNLVMNGNVEVKTESMEDTLLDLANYAIMTVIEIESRERNNENN